MHTWVHHLVCHQGGGLHKNDHNLVIPWSNWVVIGSDESPDRALQVPAIRLANRPGPALLYVHPVAPCLGSMLPKFGGKWPRHEGDMGSQSWVAEKGCAEVCIACHLPRSGPPWMALGPAGGDGHLGGVGDASPREGGRGVARLLSIRGALALASWWQMKAVV